jgi:hypothetical protein
MKQSQESPGATTPGTRENTIGDKLVAALKELKGSITLGEIVDDLKGIRLESLRLALALEDSGSGEYVPREILDHSCTLDHLIKYFTSIKDMA